MKTTALQDLGELGEQWKFQAELVCPTDTESLQ